MLFVLLRVRIGLLQISQYEEYGIGLDWTNVGEYNELTHFRMSTALSYMFWDTILYFALMVYFDHVIPSKYGVARPWYSPFQFMDRFNWYSRFTDYVCIRWFGYREKDENTQAILDKSQKMHANIDLAAIEPVDEQITGEPILDLKDLTKIYRSEGGRNNIAVNRLNLKMYKNQCFCLLGTHRLSLSVPPSQTGRVCLFPERSHVTACVSSVAL